MTKQIIKELLKMDYIALKVINSVFVSAVLLGSAYITAECLKIMNSENYRLKSSTFPTFATNVTFGLSVGLFFGLAFFQKT